MGEDRGSQVGRGRWRSRGVRVWRLLALVGAAWLLRFAAQRQEAERLTSDGTSWLARVRIHLADAASLGPVASGSKGRRVFDERGRRVGSVLTTSPDSDDVVGYSGPNKLLVVLDAEDRILGVEWLESGDTAAHVEEVRRDPRFWRSWTGWRPGAEAAPRIEAVAGSTLTSLGIAEAIEHRFSQAADSLRFPEPITLDEVRGYYTNATHLRDDGVRKDRVSIWDGAGRRLGYALRSSPDAERVRGHGGPTEALALLDADGREVRAVRVRRSYDSPEYVDRVRDDEVFLRSLAGRTIADWATMDFRAAGIEGVSGATETSYALAEGLRRKLKSEVNRTDRTESRATWGGWRWRDFILVAMVGGAIAMSFGGWRGDPRVRRIWQIVVIAGFGLGLGDLLSVALFVGWARHGLASDTAPALVLLAGAALLIPWASDRALYCHHLCPHGALQEWMASFRRWRIALPTRVSRSLEKLGPGLLLLAFCVGLAGARWDLSQLEPFDAWTLRRTAWVSGGVAVVGLVASLFVPMAYCRFGCPTGVVLKFMRSSSEDRWGGRDTVALSLIAVGAFGVAIRPAGLGMPTLERVDAPVLSGRAFGTTWSVKIRGGVRETQRQALRDRVASELERIESSFSHWRSNSWTSRFNRSTNLAEVDVPAELGSLVSRCLEISQASEGVFDVTVAPLVRAWGFGPEGASGSAADAASTASVRAAVGWQKLLVGKEGTSLRKLHPDLQLDLGAILQGYAADRVATLLSNEGHREFLIEVGGELLARGTWSVAIEAPDETRRVLRRVMLRDAALATSGTYRTRRSEGGRERSHLIDPRTGLPVEHDAVLASVVHPSCATADAWATALLVRGASLSGLPAMESGWEALLVRGSSDPWRIEATAGFPAVAEGP